MRRLFKFHHHKHTGKLIHHRHTSYGALFVLLIICGVFLAVLALSGFSAKAADLQVTATVPAPIPTGKPVFTAPDDGYVTDNPETTFEGTCPVITPAVIIALYENSSLLGSDQCSPAGTFSITAQLSPGTHTLVATVTTITNQTGESSDPLQVTYTPPVPPVTPTTPTQPSQTSSPTVVGGGIDPSLTITSERPFVLFRPSVQTEWKGAPIGGQPPYTVQINWGDGVTDTYKNKEGTHSYPHTYQSTGPYTITITITDQNGSSITRRFAAVDTSRAIAPVGLGLNVSFFDRFSDSPAFQIFVIYATVFLLLLAMWRYEFVHHRRTVGVPTHYSWQRASMGKNRHLKS